jgi:hypothetical protein
MMPNDDKDAEPDLSLEIECDDEAMSDSVMQHVRAALLEVMSASPGVKLKACIRVEKVA